MHDAVAEILHERETISRHHPLGIVASILLHIGIAALFLFGSRESRRADAKQIVNVRLAPIGRPQQPTVRQAPAQAPPVPKPAEEPAPPKVEDVKKEEPKKVDAKPVEKSLFGKSAKKPADTKPETKSPGSEVRAPGSAPPSGGALPAIGTAGVTGLEGGDFPYTIYIDRMINLIGSRWFRPQVSGDMIVQVYFVIERDGTIGDIAVEKESGSSLFDRAALRAVREASPLPPLPFGYGGSYLGVHLTFH